MSMASLSVIFAMKLRAERRRRTKVSPRFAIAIRYSLFPASSCYMNAEPGYGRHGLRTRTDSTSTTVCPSAAVPPATMLVLRSKRKSSKSGKEKEPGLRRSGADRAGL